MAFSFSIESISWVSHVCDQGCIWYISVLTLIWFLQSNHRGGPARQVVPDQLARWVQRGAAPKWFISGGQVFKRNIMDNWSNHLSFGFQFPCLVSRSGWRTPLFIRHKQCSSGVIAGRSSLTGMSKNQRSPNLGHFLRGSGSLPGFCERPLVNWCRLWVIPDMAFLICVRQVHVQSPMLPST